MPISLRWFNILFVLAVLVYRTLQLRQLAPILGQSVTFSGQLLIIVGAGAALGWVLGFENATGRLSDLVREMNLGPLLAGENASHTRDPGEPFLHRPHPGRRIDIDVSDLVVAHGEGAGFVKVQLLAERAAPHADRAHFPEFSVRIHDPFDVAMPVLAHDPGGPRGGRFVGAPRRRRMPRPEGRGIRLWSCGVSR